MLTCACWVPAGDKWRSATLSLDGLLDYDESDKDEVTFELSLFAESFQDMLMRDYGEAVYAALQSFRWAALCLNTPPLLLGGTLL